MPPFRFMNYEASAFGIFVCLVLLLPLLSDIIGTFTRTHIHTQIVVAAE